MKNFSNLVRVTVGGIGAAVGLTLEYIIDGGVTSYLPISVVLIFSVVAFLLPEKWRPNKKTIRAYLILSFVVVGLSLFDGFVTKDFDWFSISFFGAWFLFDVYWWLMFKERR